MSTAIKTSQSLLSGLVFACVLAAPMEGAFAEDRQARLNWSSGYAGAFFGAGQLDGRFLELEDMGWERADAASWSWDFDSVRSAMVGHAFDVGGVPLHLEFDSSINESPARVNGWLLRNRDEAIMSEFKWLATARVGVRRDIGRVAFFASGGLAFAQMDIESTSEDVDQDDFLRGDAIRAGWVLGAGLEAALSKSWTVRLEGMYLDLEGYEDSRRVRENSLCTPGEARYGCRDNLENRYDLLRLGIIHRFGP